MPQTGLGTNLICQIGIVVRDIERMAKACAEVFGLETPTVIITDPEEVAHTRYHGAPTPARAKLAFFPMGQVALELIEPVGGPSTWQEFLEQHGEGVHHIALRIQGMEEVLAYLEGRGISVVQRGDFTGGRYAYVDSAPALGVMLELLENLAAPQAEGQSEAQENTPTLGETLAFVAKAHQGQVDDIGQPYVLHPLRMMWRLDAEAEKMVALLHDVIEDTEYTLDDLQALGYPEDVLQAVDCLTKRKGESYEQSIERVQANPLAARVKIADLEDNMDIRRLPTLTAEDLERLGKYHQAWRRLTGKV